MTLKQFTIRATYGLALTATLGATIGIVLLLESKGYIFSNSNVPSTPQEHIEPFPVSVNTYTETITENPAVSSFFDSTLANNTNSKNNWWNQVAAVFASKDWYQNLASPVSRIVVIWPGERKEQVAKNIGDVLHWTKTDQQKFLKLMDETAPDITDGKYFPGQYVTHRQATPQDIKQIINNKFEAEILNRYPPEVNSQVPLKDALIIASLLEREASDFANMREVSGVIWNRIFLDMALQLDATLQYSKGSRDYEPKWWPVVRPSDKFIESPYNTYQNTGLPPEPIANPSAESILAALNPVVTNCLYYFHTDKGEYLCSETYEGHVKKLKSLYGRGS